MTAAAQGAERAAEIAVHLAAHELVAAGAEVRRAGGAVGAEARLEHERGLVAVAEILGALEAEARTAGHAGGQAHRLAGGGTAVDDEPEVDLAVDGHRGLGGGGAGGGQECENNQRLLHGGGV